MRLCTCRANTQALRAPWLREPLQCQVGVVTFQPPDIPATAAIETPTLHLREAHLTGGVSRPLKLWPRDIAVTAATPQHAVAVEGSRALFAKQREVNPVTTSLSMPCIHS